jgi:uncharacterized repeat protein (TIGR01451 family)
MFKKIFTSVFFRLTVGMLAAGVLATPAMAVADLALTKTLDSLQHVEATGTDPAYFVASYTITVTNNGPDSSLGSSLFDTLPAGMTLDPGSVLPSNLNCIYLAGLGVLCNGEDLLVGQSYVVPIVGRILDSAIPEDGYINNRAVVTGSEAFPPEGGQSNEDSALTFLRPVVHISKTSSPQGPLAPGDDVTYTVTVSNLGEVPAPGTRITDAPPPGIDPLTWAWTCFSTGGALCPSGSGAGPLDETLAVFPPHSTVTYTITAKADNSEHPSIVNTAEAEPPQPDSACDKAPKEGGTSPPCVATVTNRSAPMVKITKQADTATLTPGGTVVFTVTVSNEGKVAAPGTVVSDPMVEGIAAMTWTCAASGVACPNNSGSGDLQEVLPNFPPGGVVTYTITATLFSSGLPQSLTNTSTAALVQSLCADSTTAEPCSAQVTLAALLIDPHNGGGPAAAIPTLDARALIGLMLLLSGLIGFTQHTKRRR